MIEVRNLAFAYGDRQVLQDVSFVVSPGEVVSVVGDNGAGKTTLLRILATLTLPDSGKVLMEGQDAFSRPMRYRRQMGFLPEKVALYGDMTVKEYLHYRAELKGEPMRRIRRRVGEAVELCRISSLLRSHIHTLSLGQTRRVALADAILLRPRLLLLDDLLSGLDQHLRQDMGAVLSEAASFSSVIVTGHCLADMAKWSTRFMVLQKGVIASSIETAGHDQVSLVSRLEQTLKGVE